MSSVTFSVFFSTWANFERYVIKIIIISTFSNCVIHASTVKPRVVVYIQYYGKSIFGFWFANMFGFGIGSAKRHSPALLQRCLFSTHLKPLRTSYWGLTQSCGNSPTNFFIKVNFKVLLTWFSCMYNNGRNIFKRILLNFKEGYSTTTFDRFHIHTWHCPCSSFMFDVEQEPESPWFLAVK